MGPVQYNALVHVIRFWGVPKTSPNEDVYPEVSVSTKGFPALYLIRDPKPLYIAGDRIEELLVPFHLCAGSGTDAFVSGVHIA